MHRYFAAHQQHVDPSVYAQLLPADWQVSVIDVSISFGIGNTVLPNSGDAAAGDTRPSYRKIFFHKNDYKYLELSG